MSLRLALREAKLVEGIDVFGIASITQFVAFLRRPILPVDPVEIMVSEPAGMRTLVLTWRIWSVRPRRSGPAK